ncbi:transposase [Flammeovirga yaeyamensis]|uniref:Transposase n=1 Tax=Flammeovirga yaeyamensis TaxID=367791 RepID=A0AAX1N6X8_9BACT|nr:7TM diverse intracellular signaling domain-containing protein [Flammeovirga yaeyamensis]MBB3697853.1 hypothetical protein [Flammeovirga yaeyamensis]NMF35792.1 hypothetical protein [Flammeovirga yaeyamensis]QWG03256.1 transposase [Flammeovirga yaeyamensis]
MKLSLLLRIYIFILIQLFWSSMLQANTLDEIVIDNPQNEDVFFIRSSQVKVFVEKGSNEVDIQEILKDSTIQFQPLKSESIFITDQSIKEFWVKIQLNGNVFTHDRWIFEIPDSHIGEVQAYIHIVGDTLLKVEKAGYQHRFHTRNYKHKNIIFPMDQVNLRKGDKVEVYLRYDTPFQNVLFYKISKAKAFIRYSNTEYLMLGLNYGILVCLIVTSILLFLTIKDKFLLFLILFLLGSICIGLSEDNLASEYLFNNYPGFNYILLKFSATISMISIVLMATQFLEIRKENLKVYSAIIGISLLNAFYFLTFKTLNDSIWKLPTFLIPFLIILGYIFTERNQKKQQVKYFLLGYLIILTGLVFQVLRSYGIFVSANILIVYSYNIGLLLTGLFMTLSQTERYKILKEEKDKAQQELIKDLKIREKVIEDKVEERTEKIKSQNLIIENKNKELEWVNDELNQQRLKIQELNKQLKIENEKLHEDVEHLETARVLMQEVTFEEFEGMFPTDESCYNYLEEIKWKEGFQCKKCGHDDYATGTGHNARRCKKCNYNESVTSGTLFHRLHFPIKKAFYMVFIVYAKKGEISSTKLAEVLEMRQNTCWKFSKKINESMLRKKEELGSEEALRKQGWEALIIT